MAAVTSDGSRIEYEVTGNGPPLVLLHGFFDLTIPLALEFLGRPPP